MTPMKDKNSYPKWDLNLWPLGLKSKTLPLTYGELLHNRLENTLQMNTPMMQFLPFLANLRHFAPPYTYIPSKDSFSPTFSHKINFPCQSVLSFQISIFGDIFEMRRPIFKIFSGR